MSCTVSLFWVYKSRVFTISKEKLLLFFVYIPIKFIYFCREMESERTYILEGVCHTSNILYTNRIGRTGVLFNNVIYKEESSFLFQKST